MKKYLLSLAVIFSFIGYALRGQLGKLERDDEHVVPAPNLSNSTANQNSRSVTSGTNDSTAVSINTNSTTAEPSTNVNSPSTPITVNGKYKNGQYSGMAADAYYGYVQVRVTVADGKLTDVEFLQYPNDRQNSIEINSYAMPILRREAIQAQSAQVDVVSGATDTSYAFQQSLQSALSQA